MIHYYSSKNYILTLLCALLGLCGRGRYVRLLLRKNIYGFSSDQKNFISRYAGYGSFILIFLLGFFSLRFLFALPDVQMRDRAVIISVLVAWFVALIGIFHLQAPLFYVGAHTKHLYFTFFTAMPRRVASFFKYLIHHSVFPFVLLIGFCTFASANVSLSLTGMQFVGGQVVYQGTEPSVSAQIFNDGSDPATITNNTTQLATGFISCSVGTTAVFRSDAIDTLTINPNSSVSFPLTLNELASQNLGDQTLSCRLANYPGRTVNTSSQTLSFRVEFMPQGRFDRVLGIVKEPISDKLDSAVAEVGLGGIKTRVFGLIDKLVVPGMTLLGIFFALLLMYRMMFSHEKESLKELRGLILWPIVGFILIFSARFVGHALYDITHQGTIGPDQFSLVQIVSETYDTILFPFLKIAFYLMMAALFVILLIRAFSFVTAADDEVRTKAGNTIIGLTVGLLLVIGSKQLVEGVYGKEEQIRNATALAVNDIGSAFLTTKNIPIIYDVIQWVIGLTGFIILTIIIFQTFKLLVQPTTEDNLKSIGKSILYAVIGMVVLGAGYLLVNVVMLN